MGIDISSYDIYKLVLPVECTTFINIHCWQPEGNGKIILPAIGNFFTQEAFSENANKKGSPISKVDCVILHLTINKTFMAHDVTDSEVQLSESFIEQLYCVLKPNAVVIIRRQISLEFTVQGMINLCRIALEWLKKPFFLKSFSGYDRMLKAKKFKNIRSFNVVSGWDSPFAIISTEHTASKYFFSTYVENRRKKYTHLKYFFMKFLVALNLIRFLEGDFLIVAQK